MQNRISQLKKTNNIRSSNDLNGKTLQEVHDDMLKTGFPKRNKFVSKNMENVQRAGSRYDREQYNPGNSAQNVIIRKSSMKRPIKTAKSKPRKYGGYEIPFHAKPIKIHCESS